jgi:RNA polymerase sigma-70 factor (ECF subfamily)
MAAMKEQALSWFAAGWLEADGVEDAPSIAELVRAHSGVLFRVAYSVVRHRDEAEDVVQETFLRAVQRRRTLGEIAAVRSWLIRIAWNLAVDRRRRARTDQMEPEFAAQLMAQAPAAEDALDAGRRMVRVLAAMDTLPKSEKQVLLLCAIDELSHREIAAAMGKSEASVRGLLFRARARLRQMLGEERR